MGKREEIPHRFGDRALRTSRIARAAISAGAKRLVRRSAEDDRGFGEALVGELDTMKGMAMKVGQILSYMDGALPEHTQAALRKLQRGAEPLAFEVVRATLEEVLGAPVSECFDRLDPTPIAAASIGQVHRGAAGGREVAVKVQYPHVAQTFEADIAQMRRIASVASLATRVDGQAIVTDLHARLMEECDYSFEARWLGAFGEAFAGEPGVRLPRVVPELSRTRVLTTTWCEGRDLYDFAATASDGARQRAARTLVRFALRSLFVHGVINADPHPGNYLFEDDGTVTFLDFGCIRRFDDGYLERERALVQAVIDGDRVGFPRAAVASGMVADARRFDFDHHWAMLRYQYEPYLAPDFAFTPEYGRRGRQFSGPDNPNARRMAIPPEWIWTVRLLWGLHAVLTRLGARGDFGTLLREALATPRRPLDATDDPEAVTARWAG